MNYTELSTAIQDFAENYEATFLTHIPDFVRQAEEGILRAVRIPELRKVVTNAATSGSPYYARPSDFLSPISMSVADGTGDYVILRQKDATFIREAYPSPTTDTGVPKFYGVYSGDVFSGGSETDSGDFILGPTPDSNYSITLEYYYDPVSIVTSSTSWLGDNAETALLYGSLLHAYVFMKGDQDVMSAYKAAYDAALADLVRLGRAIYVDDFGR